MIYEASMMERDYKCDLFKTQFIGDPNFESSEQNLIYSVFEESCLFKLPDELCKEVSYMIWSYSIVRFIDLFKGIFTK